MNKTTTLFIFLFFCYYLSGCCNSNTSSGRYQFEKEKYIWENWTTSNVEIVSYDR